MPEPTLTNGETVFLLGERRSAAGRVHEIGTRARVVALHDGELQLELDGDTLLCPADLVARSRPTRFRPYRPAYRRGGGMIAAV